jgi:peptidyl-Asp metalloendopeptidase
VTWTAPAGGASASDWVSLYRVGATNGEYGWWRYTNGALSGSFTLSAPGEAGQYEFRYLVNNSYTSVAASNTITVQTSGNPTPSPTPTANPTPSARTNAALAANGALAQASSVLSSPMIAIDGVRNWATSGAWKDATADSYPDWFEVAFAGNKTIDEIAIYLVRDDYLNPTDPSETETFSSYGVTAFEVQYWTGTAWATVPGGSIANNNRVLRKITFAPITTTRIRVVVNNAQASYSRIVELEAWTTNGGGGNPTPSPTATPNTTPTPQPTATPTPSTTPTPGSRTNVALANNGATVTASSATSSSYSPAAAIDGFRTWASGGGWRDGTPDVYPDWLEVSFNGNKTVSEISVFAVRDNYADPSDPTAAETFSQYGITNFEIQYWTGANWETVPGGQITNNNFVWTRIAFAPISTSRIRVVVNNAQASYSRIVELEAWSDENGYANAPLPNSADKVNNGNLSAVATAWLHYVYQKLSKGLWN